MDINQPRRGETAPTPNNTPRSNAPINNNQNPTQKGKNNNNNQQQQNNQNQQQKGQNQEKQLQQNNQNQQQKGQNNQNQNQQNQPKQKGQNQQQQNQQNQNQQQKGQNQEKQQQQQLQQNQQQKGQNQEKQQQNQQQNNQNQQQGGGKKNKGNNNNAVVVSEKSNEPSPAQEGFKVELSDAMMNNPFLSQMLQNKLNSLIGEESGYLQSLPTEVQRRVRALKNLQDEHAKLDADFREEVLKLEAKYLGLKKPLYQKRAAIVTGANEPTDEECERPDEEIEEEISNRLQITGGDEEDEEQSEPEQEVSSSPKGKKGKKQQQQQQSSSSPKGKKGKKQNLISGIPEFWLTAFKNHGLIAESIQEYDEPLLRTLTDVTLAYSEDNLAFTISFDFAPNEYFTNPTLTKTYYLQNNVDSSMDDLIFVKSEGCTINWKPEKDVTVKQIIKKQKNKANKKVRVVKTLVPQDSFFRFFSPPELPEKGEKDEDGEGDEDDEDFVPPELETQLELDFELGEVLKTKIIPDAVHWFTGEALQYDQDYEDYDEEEYDEDEDDEEGEDDDDGQDDDQEDDDDNDDDDVPRRGAPKRGGPPPRGGKSAGGASGDKPAECNQQ